MKYFKRVTSLDELKKQYRALALVHHPDQGGDVEIMKQINLEYDELYTSWYAIKASDTEYESPETSRRGFYEENGWKGQNYDRNRSMKEVTSLIRAYIKKHYPYCKFSITRKDYNSINIVLLSGAFRAFVETINEDDRARLELRGELAGVEKILKKQYMQVNPYYIKDSSVLTPYVKSMLSDIQAYANSYNFDYSDAMSDYFHRGFYLWLAVGRYDMPYQQTGDMKFNGSQEVMSV